MNTKRFCILFGRRNFILRQFRHLWLLATALLMSLVFSGYASVAASGLILPGYQTGCTSIAYGQSLTDAISTQGEVDCFIFSGIAGQRVTAFLDNRASGRLSLRLIQPGGSSLAFCDFTSSDCQLDNVALPSTGSYTLVVAAGGTTIYLDR